MPSRIEAYRRRIQQVRRGLRASSELVIFVWGPGEANEGSEKRTQLRDELRNLYEMSGVYFSEDADVVDATPGAEDLSFHERERWHLAAADLCIVLDTSAGPREEIAHFASHPRANRLVIFTPENLKDARGFPANLRERLRQLYFTPQEWKSCNVVARAINIVDNEALALRQA